MLVMLDDDLGRLTLQRVRPWHLMLARFQAGRLDRELAGGADPEQCASLAARAMQLTSEKSRRGLAASLLRLREASTGPGAIPLRVPVRWERLSQATAELGELASHLLAPVPVPARGVAMVSQLLSDGTGPLYDAASREDLRASAQRAAEALAG
jgi:hypothetical protein